MKKVGANSDIHGVVFDEENRAVGFQSKSGECTGGVRIFIWYGWKAYSIYYNFHEEILEARDYRVHIGYIPLLTLSVLRNNDAVVSAGRAPLRQRRWECSVEIEFPVPARLPKSVEAPLSIVSVFRFTREIDWQVHHMKLLSRVDRYRYRKALFIGFTPSFGLRVACNIISNQMGHDLTRSTISYVIFSKPRTSLAMGLRAKFLNGGFEALGVSKFSGSVNSVEADKWLNRVLKIRRWTRKDSTSKRGNRQVEEGIEIEEETSES
uniref:Uncharacterized protein n=1 Tax=Cucumis melo TaxID=3656 RepID=A0A9I9EG62_CUCME